MISLLICTGNCLISNCSTEVFSAKIVSNRLRIAELPVKFPDSREFAWRRVRSALRRQPGSPGLRENAPDSSRKARQQPAFAIRRPVSLLPIPQYEDRIRRKSLANTANIPVLGRRWPETGFDHGLRGDRSRSLNERNAADEPENEADPAGVTAGPSSSDRAWDRHVATLISSPWNNPAPARPR